MDAFMSLTSAGGLMLTSGIAGVVKARKRVAAPPNSTIAIARVDIETTSTGKDMIQNRQIC
jgi:uncharacterized lipoprotein YbaY